MRNKLLKHIGIGIVFVLSQLLIFQYLTIYGTIADPVLVFVLWTALRYKRHEVLFFAAGLGLFQDALFDSWGLNMFAKTITMFLIYKIVSRNSEVRLIIWQAFVLILGAAFLHNIFYLGFSSFLNIYEFSFSPIILLVGSSLYTALIGSVLHVLKGDAN
ncbi:MAG: rod shape-determining protein MreD [Balneola sp.]